MSYDSVTALLVLAFLSLASASIICPQDMNLVAGPNCMAVAHFTAAISTTGAQTQQIDGLYTGEFYPIGETVNTFRDIDGSTCDFTVSVFDADAPTLTCPHYISQGTDFGQCYATLHAQEPSAVDCSAFEITQTEGLPLDQHFLLGARSMTYEATDEFGNTASCTFTVTISEAIPQVECPNNMIVDADDHCEAVVDWRYPLVIACHANDFIQTSGQAPGSTYSVGEHEHSFTSTTEISGFETVECFFTVTVRDSTPPTINCADEILVIASYGECQETASYPVPHAHDNCGVSSVEQLEGFYESDEFPVGTTLNLFQAIDAAGNIAQCSVPVRVADTQAPIITCPNHLHVASDTCENGEVAYPMPVATDNCVNVQMELVSGFIRGGVAPYGTTDITYKATDDSGNWSACTFQVTQSDPSPPEIFCEDGFSVETNPGSCYGTLTYNLPRAIDDCTANPIVEMYDSVPSGSMVHAGTIVVQFRATDGGGLSSVCDAVFHVEDLEAPTITCPETAIIGTNHGECFATFLHEQPVTVDNCRTTTVTQVSGPESGENFLLGVNDITFVAEDLSMNHASCSYQVIVQDNEPPQVTCPPDLYYLADIGTCSAAPAFSASATDNCDISFITMQYDFPSGSSLEVGVHTNTFTARDPFNREASCSFDVTVSDSQLPILTCPHKVTVPIGEPLDYTVTGTDNCPNVGVLHTAGPAPGAVLEPGTYTVEWQATDHAGLVSRCSFPVTVDTGIIEPADDGNIYLFTDFNVEFTQELTDQLPGPFVGFHLETLDTQMIVYSSEQVAVSSNPIYRNLMMCTPGTYRFVLISGNLKQQGPTIRVCTADTIDFPQGCVVP